MVRMRNRFRQTSLLALITLIGGLGVWHAPAATVARLNGSFIQYWSVMQSWPAQNWLTILGRMQELQMDTVIIQTLASENSDGSIHSFIGPPGQPDPTETILRFADTNNFKVFLGLYMPNWNHDMTGADFLTETQTRMATVAQQAWNRYLANQQHPSFAGWYIPYEPWTAAYSAAEVGRLRAFFQGIAAACQQVAGDWPLAISPFISEWRPSPCQVETLYRQLFDQSGIGIVLLQDSVGAQQWYDDIVPRAAPYFQAFQNACDATGVQLWANLESFQITNSIFTACDATRLRQQFDAATPFVERFVTFDFLHYMNPDVFLSSWNPNRRARMKQLFNDYRAAFVHTEYAPLSPPAIRVRVNAAGLWLSWSGIPGDSFQVQSCPSLDAPWSPLPAEIVTNGYAFACVTPLPAHTCFYRVQRVSRLQLPDSMVWIPPGSFLMGTAADDPHRTADELAQFSVTFTRGFWIGRHEVTQSEYQNLLCANPAAFRTNLENPVEKVSWAEAVEYCRRLTEREQQAGRLPADYAYRLPTEAEWEYATRAGSLHQFTFGDDFAALAQYGWYSTNSGGNPHPVGALLPNAWGLQDVHGNVLEWCWDWINPAPAGSVTNFCGTTNGLYRVARGGHWSSPWTHCRCGWRQRYLAVPATRQSYLGFRVVLAPPDS
jgi:formylglycine-generating enzyme required for sulfatase activity